MSPRLPVPAHSSTPGMPLPAIVSSGRMTALWGHHTGAGEGRWARSPRALVASPTPCALVARPQHLLCCARRWRSPGASRCRPCGPSGACAGSAGNAGSAGTWPGHCPGCPRRPQARRRSARRCLGTETERQWAGPPGPAARPPEAAPASTRARAERGCGKRRRRLRVASGATLPWQRGKRDVSGAVEEPLSTFF